MEKIVYIREKGAEFEGYIDLSNIVDSLQLDSDQVICKYVSADKKFQVTIEVRGEVNIDFSPTGDFDECDRYKYPSEFPKALKEIIARGEVYNSPYVYISNNNWFELFYWDEEGQFLDSDVVDVEKSTFEDLFVDCEESLKQYRKNMGV